MTVDKKYAISLSTFHFQKAYPHKLSFKGDLMFTFKQICLKAENPERNKIRAVKV